MFRISRHLEISLSLDIDLSLRTLEYRGELDRGAGIQHDPATIGKNHLLHLTFRHDQGMILNHILKRIILDVFIVQRSQAVRVLYTFRGQHHGLAPASQRYHLVVA